MPSCARHRGARNSCSRSTQKSHHLQKQALLVSAPRHCSPPRRRITRCVAMPKRSSRAAPLRSGHCLL